MTTIQPISVDRYMHIRSASAAKFGFDDAHVYFISNLTGLPQVWRQGADVPWPQQVTFFDERVMSVAPSPSADIVCVNADAGGSERAQLYLVSGDGTHVENVSNDPEHIYEFGGWTRDGSAFAYASNRRDGAHFDVFVYDLQTRQHRLVHQSDHTNHAAGFSPDGSTVLISRHYTSNNNDLFAVGVAGGDMRLLTEHSGDALYRMAHLSSFDGALYLATDEGGEFFRLARIDLTTGERRWLTQDRWDVQGVAWSADDRSLVFAKNEDGTSRLYYLELSEQNEEAQLVSGIPTGQVGGLAWSHHDRRVAFTLSSPTQGTEAWILDPESGAQRLTFASISGVPHETFVEPELIHYTSFDGLQIPAYYYRPAGRTGPFPVVVDVHGGPEGQSANGFAPLRQYLVNCGFAVLAPNVRGSSGYGRTYGHLDDVRKRMDSVADLAHCVDWLTAHGNADPKAIAVMGGSYGGFMVLAAVTHYPDLWAAGVDTVGIANLRSFMQNTSAYRRHLRESEYGSIEQDGDFFDEISPIHHVDNIKAPMMIIHGANDPRVPVDEAEQIVGALQARSHPVSYLRFEDEGHGIVKLHNRITTYTAIAHFLDAHLNRH
jgi:dipeptidyl aminopeptidase/acylaminoacyl peptidase